MIRKLYDWTMRQAEHPQALWILAFVAFIESSFFPIPPDALMIPMILAAPQRAWKIAAVATAASVLGGLFGYGIGYFFWEGIGEPMLSSLGKAEKMIAFGEKFNDQGFWAVLGAGITPFPFKVITIMSGWTQMPLATFVTTAIIARSLRFFVVAALLKKFGNPIRDFIEKRLGLVFTAFLVLLVGGFFVLKYL